MARKPAAVRSRELLIALGLCLVILWLTFLVFGIARKEEIARRAAGETRAELEALKEREEGLSATLSELSTERGQEATLRETYGVARPGEEVIIVVPSTEATTTLKLPFWKRFLGWFGIWN